MSRVLILLLLTTVMFLHSPALAQHEQKTVDGIEVTFAIASVDDIKMHPEEHPEQTMHGGPKGTHHILIHLEDTVTGEVVRNAKVSAAVRNPDGAKVTEVLEPMNIGGITDFGNFFDMFDMKEIGNYHIDILITSKTGKTIKVNFVYERRQGH